MKAGDRGEGRVESLPRQNDSERRLRHDHRLPRVDLVEPREDQVPIGRGECSSASACAYLTPQLPFGMEGGHSRRSYVRRAAPEVIATPSARSPPRFCACCSPRRPAGRDQATIQLRRRASGLPAGKTFDAWDETASPIPKATQHASRTLEWIGRAEALCVCGPSGTGNSHLVKALGHPATDRGKSVAWHTLENLATLLRRHRAHTTPSTAPTRHRQPRDRAPDPRRPDRDRRHRDAPRRPRRRRGAVPRR
jgi:hypothetical protein